MSTPTTTAPAYVHRYTISDIKHHNKEAGRFFFSKGGMRFFNSKILPTVYSGPGGYFFVTSEQFDSRSPRQYTVRSFDPKTGEVDTVGEFNKLDRSEAQANARNYAKNGAE